MSNTHNDPRTFIPNNFGDVMSSKTTTLLLPNEFSGLERICLTANGNLQRILSSWFNKTVIIDIVKNDLVDIKMEEKKTNTFTVDNVISNGNLNYNIINICDELPILKRFDREVNLVCEGKIVCNAKSDVIIKDNNIVQLIEHEGVGIDVDIAKSPMNETMNEKVHEQVHEMAYVDEVVNIITGAIFVYDLGLTKKQRDEIKILMKLGYFDELRVFNFSEYPSFWNITIARGEYAWKPGIVAEVAKEYPGIITWLDSGTLPEKAFFENMSSLLEEYDGLLSPNSPGLMRTWTHPGVYDYYGDDETKYYDFPSCNAASIVFDTKKVQHIIDDWYSCALVKDCIAPVGSSRTNHRQDQAILTYLAAREGRYCFLELEELWLHTHEDRNCSRIINFHEKSNKVKIKNH
ncbi:782_t:CDS:2 [Funneliformis geosporum]|uniref:782_t:CDS:1 n=1 Tax=Funneliformis geosporum TaxID=1117311 RepID=A0A9W4WUE0_9GLOM|nr:782_t:CDS:2 [Funneliformis geosporum]